MIDVVLQFLDGLTPDRTELTVHVVDVAGHPIPDAQVRVVEENDLHNVNTFNGEWTASEVYLKASELAFSRGTTLHLVVASPRHKAQVMEWVSPGGKHDALEVALKPIEFRDFAGGAPFDYSLGNFERVLAPGTAPIALLSSFGRSLATQTPKLEDVLDWTNLALTETAAAYTGHEYVERTWRLHGIRAVAANRELSRLLKDPTTTPGRDPAFAIQQSQRQAGRLARTWGEYALASNTDARLAIDLCTSATANPMACPIAD